MIDWKYDYEKVIEKDLNILFLDIDGVLNYASQTPANSYGGRFINGEEIEPKLVKKFNKVFEEIPNLKIVISSSWRGNMKRLVWALKFAGFLYVENIIGRTPRAIAVTKKHCKGETIDLPTPYTLLYERRGQQILKWFLDNPGISKRMNTFIIIDDEKYDISGKMGFNFLDQYFIQTNSNIGLSNTDIQSIISHFKKGEKDETNQN